MKTLLVTIAVIVGIYAGSALVSSIMKSTAASTVKQDAYSEAQTARESSRQTIVNGCVAEAPGSEAYCGCYADNFLNTDRETFNALMAKSARGELVADDVMTYAEPCFYLLAQ